MPKPATKTYEVNVLKFEVKSGKNLADLLLAFPNAMVETLINSPGEDSWRLTIPCGPEPTTVKVMVKPGAAIDAPHTSEPAKGDLTPDSQESPPTGTSGATRGQSGKVPLPPEKIRDLGFSKRTENKLKRLGIYRTDELLKAGHQELTAIVGFGIHTMAEIRGRLRNLAIEWK